MALQDKYINPFTDYRFKKLFEAAEIARFNPKEKARYEESLKYYRDLKNVVDTSYEEGREDGREEGREEGKKEKEIELILNSKEAGIDLETISKIVGKSIDEIKQIIINAEGERD